MSSITSERDTSTPEQEEPPHFEAIRQMTMQMFGGPVSNYQVHDPGEDEYTVFVATVREDADPVKIGHMHGEWHRRLRSIVPENFGSLRLRVKFDDHGA